MNIEQLERVASNTQKTGKATKHNREDAADPRIIQDSSLASSHKMNETAESGSHDQLHEVALYTSVTHN